jgi:transcriptional regulator with XRE-family HTH domain
MGQPDQKNTASIQWTPKAIRSLRLRLGWSAADFSRHFGCLSSQILDWESGSGNPSQSDIFQLQRLTLTLEAYSTRMQCSSLSDQVIKSHGVEQVHNDLLISYLNN